MKSFDELVADVLALIEFPPTWEDEGDPAPEDIAIREFFNKYFRDPEIEAEFEAYAAEFPF